MKGLIACCGLDCESCGACPDVRTCGKVGAIHRNSADARRNLGL